MTLLNTRPQRQAHEHMAQRAARLWPGEPNLQLEWLRAVTVVRGTRRGWLLDTYMPRKEAVREA